MRFTREPAVNAELNLLGLSLRARTIGCSVSAKGGSWLALLVIGWFGGEEASGNANSQVGPPGDADFQTLKVLSPTLPEKQAYVCSAPSFLTAKLVHRFTATGDITSGDFNGDHHLDVVTLTGTDVAIREGLRETTLEFQSCQPPSPKGMGQALSARRFVTKRLALS